MHAGKWCGEDWEYNGGFTAKGLSRQKGSREDLSRLYCRVKYAMHIHVVKAFATAAQRENVHPRPRGRAYSVMMMLFMLLMIYAAQAVDGGVLAM